MPTTSTIQAVAVKLPNGTELPMRARMTKSGNTAWAALCKKASGERYYSQYGVRVTADVIGGAAPKAGEHVEVQGAKFALETKKNQRDQVQVRTTGDLTIPGVGKKVFKLIITDVGDGEFNLIAEVHGKSEGGGRKAIADL